MGKKEELPHALERGPLQGGDTQAKACGREEATPWRGKSLHAETHSRCKGLKKSLEIEETGKEKCGYRAASKGDGLHMQEEGYDLKEIKEDFLFSGFDRERVDLLI